MFSFLMFILALFLRNLLLFFFFLLLSKKTRELTRSSGVFARRKYSCLGSLQLPSPFFVFVLTDWRNTWEHDETWRRHRPSRGMIELMNASAALGKHIPIRDSPRAHFGDLCPHYYSSVSAWQVIHFPKSGPDYDFGKFQAGPRCSS